MNLQELNEGFEQVEASMSRANSCARRGVSFVAGRLRTLYLDIEVLRKIKRELQGFDAKRGKWTN